MLPISRVTVAKRERDPFFEWALFDVYRLGIGDYALESDYLGHIRVHVSHSGCNESSCTLAEAQRSNLRTYQATGSFLSSRRKNLKGVSVICGLVVSPAQPI